MKFRNLLLASALLLPASTILPLENNIAVAKESTASLQKQIKQLKAQSAKQSKQINQYKKEIKQYKSKLISISNTKLDYQGNVISGNYKVGNTTVPSVIKYKGIQYAPVNLVGNLLSTKTFYNKSSNIVYFGSEPNGSYLSDILNPYYSTYTTYTNKTMYMGGIEYNKGFRTYTSGIDEKMVFNLNKKYTHLTGLLGLEDSIYSGPSNFEIYGDGKLLATYNLKTGDLPANVDLQVKNVSKLEINFIAPGNDSMMNFVNVIVK